MAKILMLNLPAHGHINPTLAIAKELMARGHQVTYLITSEFRKKIETTGASVICYDEDKPRKHSLIRIMVNRAKWKRKALSIGSGYDCILYEMIFPEGKKIGEELNIPAIRLSSVFAFNKTVIDHLFSAPVSYSAWLKRKLMQRMLLRLANRKAPDLNIVFTSHSFQYASDSFNTEQYKFTGPSIMERKEECVIPFNRITGKIIYISMGTIFNWSKQFFIKCIKAFGNSDYTIIMSIGTKLIINKLGAIPANFYVYPYVSQLEVLKQADVFITHGGMNSANEAIYFAVPVIVIPQGADQPLVGKRIEQLSLGKRIDKKKVTVQKLRDSVTEVLGNSQYKSNMEKMSKEMHEAGGFAQAVTEIETYLHNSTFAPVESYVFD